MTWDEVLDLFKRDESPESLIQLIEDPELRVAIVAWQAVAVEVDKGHDCPIPVEDVVGRWEWLWSHVRYDKEHFAVVANIRKHNVSHLMTRLIGLRLIYPDGTIHGMARNYLKCLIMSKLPKDAKDKKDKGSGSG